MTRLEIDGFRWELQDAFPPVLKDLLTSPGRIVKESPAKLVSAHEVGETTYFVKRYRSDGIPFRALKFFFKKSQARQEWELARRLEALQVPIVRHQALGERWELGGLRESILITEGFDGVALNEAGELQAEVLFKFLDRLYNQGVIQRDLHPGNILIHAQTGEMRLVDLHGIRIQSSVTQAEREANLAFLNVFLPLPVSQGVRHLSHQLRKEHLARRSLRCLKNNREFVRKTFGSLEWCVRRPFLNPTLESILADPERFLETRAEVFKTGRSGKVGCADGLVLKRFDLRKFSRVPVDWFRPSRARRAYRKAYHLELAGLPTARAIATADQRIARFLYRSYFVMEELRGAMDLSQWQGDLRHGIRTVAALIAKMHDEGFSHRDLKETNVVFDQAGQPHLLDLEGLNYLGTLTPRKAALDLRRLHRAAVEQLPRVSKTDRQNFLRAYCKARGVRPRALFSTLQK